MGLTDSIKSMFIGLFVAVLVAVVTLFILSNTVKSTLLSPEFYETQFEKANIYSKIQDALVDLLASSLTSQTGSAQGSSPIPGTTLTEQQIKTELRAAFTRDWVKTEINRLVKGFFAYLNGQTNQFSLSVSVKSRLVTAATSVLSKQYPELPSTLVKEQVETVLLKDIPEPLDLANLLGMQSLNSQLTSARDAVQTFRSVSGLFPIIIILLVVLIFILIRDVGQTAKTIGIPLFLSAIPSVILTYLAPTILTSLISSLLPGIIGTQGAQQTDQLGTLVSDLSKFFEPVVQDLGVQYVYLTIISVILIGIGYLLPMMGKKKETKGKKDDSEEKTDEEEEVEEEDEEETDEEDEEVEQKEKKKNGKKKSK